MRQLGAEKGGKCHKTNASSTLWSNLELLGCKNCMLTMSKWSGLLGGDQEKCTQDHSALSYNHL